MGFDFAWAFWLLLALVPAAWLLRRSEFITKGVMQAFKSPPPNDRYFVIRMILIGSFVVSLVVVVSSPYVEPRTSGDYFLLIDTSRSMQARNSCGEPTFFDRARGIMSDILEGVPEGRFGIVVFDRLTFPVTQLTYDHEYLNEVIVKSLSIGMAYQATTTNIENALSVVAQKKRSLPEIFGEVEHIFLISDGHMNSNEWRQEVAKPLQELLEANIKVTTIGIGNPIETPIPIISSAGNCRDEYIRINGEVLRIPLRDDILKFVAAETHGKYFGEGQTSELIKFIRDETMTATLPDNIVFSSQQRESISWYFLLLATVSFFGFLVIRSG
jgi:hypothetical protein